MDEQTFNMRSRGHKNVAQCMVFHQGVDNTSLDLSEDQFIHCYLAWRQQ